MWTSTLDSAGGFLTALALLLTAVGTLVLALQKIFRPSDKDRKAASVVSTGHEVRAEPSWLVALRVEAARVPSLADDNDRLNAEVTHLRSRLDKARMRLAQNGLPYKDLY